MFCLFTFVIAIPLLLSWYRMPVLYSVGEIVRIKVKEQIRKDNLAESFGLSIFDTTVEVAV